MSLSEEKEKLEKEAYTVVDATNEDGTIDGEIIEVPERNGDTLSLTIAPLAPTFESKEIELDWPKQDDTEYDIVKLCEQKVGGFQSVAQLKNKKVKLDPIPEDNDFEIVIEDEKTKQDTEDEENDNDGGDKELQKDLFKYTFNLGLSFVTRTLVIISILGMITPFVLFLLLPWGITVLSIWQGISLLLGSIMLWFFAEMAQNNFEIRYEE